MDKKVNQTHSKDRCEVHYKEVVTDEMMNHWGTLLTGKKYVYIKSHNIPLR